MNPQRFTQKVLIATIAREQGCMRFAPANSKEAPPQIMCKLGKTAGSISSRLTLPKLHLATKHQSFSVHVHFDMYI